jgi:hypothetical protein
MKEMRTVETVTRRIERDTDRYRENGRGALQSKILLYTPRDHPWTALHITTI